MARAWKRNAKFILRKREGFFTFLTTEALRRGVSFSQRLGISVIGFGCGREASRDMNIALQKETT
jgi:hypothetical protein